MNKEEIKAIMIIITITITITITWTIIRQKLPEDTICICCGGRSGVVLIINKYGLPHNCSLDCEKEGYTLLKELNYSFYKSRVNRTILGSLINCAPFCDDESLLFLFGNETIKINNNRLCTGIS